MIYNIIDLENNITYSNIKVAKNCKKIVAKAEEELTKVFNKKVRLLFTGKIDIATGELTGYYVALGINKKIKIEGLK